MKKYGKITGFLSRILMLSGMLTLLAPLQAAATEQEAERVTRDAVSLIQNEDKVEVLLTMSNSTEERITAVSVALEIDQESRDKVTVGFDFAPELSGVEKNAFYDESTGVLNVYAASTRTLFGNETLKLGAARVQPKDSSQVLNVAVSYRGASFQTANGVYGRKVPMVARISDPVDMQVGQGVVYDVSGALKEYLQWAMECQEKDYTALAWENLQKLIQEAQALLGKADITSQEANDMTERLVQAMRSTGAGMDTGNGGNTAGGADGAGAPSTDGAGSGQGGNGAGGQGSESDNVSQGLYDESQSFVHESGEVHPIQSTVVRDRELMSGLVDMSQGTAAQVVGKPSTPGSGRAPVKARVSVVAPEDGPASIHVAGTGGQGLENGQITDSQTSDGEGQTDRLENESAGEEIRLDQTNGGVQGSNKMKISMPVLAGCAAAAAAVLGGAAYFLITGRRSAPGKRRKRPARKKKKKPVHKKKKPARR